MRLRSRRILAAATLSALALLSRHTAPAAPASVATTPSVESNGATAYYRPEVRLRKLHLVRPDLIPYPIAYAVYC